MRTLKILFFYLLITSNSLLVAQTNYGQGVKLENGSDLNFQAFSLRQEDAGDVIFSKYNNQEMARIRSEYDSTNDGASIIFSTTPAIKTTFTFTSTGNLGIGSVNPQASIDINKSYDVNNTKFIKLMYSGTWGTPQYANNYRFIDIQSSEEGNILALNPYGMGIGYNPPAYSSNDRLYIKGNVGIGTENVSFQTRLHVKESGSSATIWRGRIVASGDLNAIVMGEYNGKSWLGAHNSQLNAWTDLIIQAEGGNVGIGTTNPTNKLDVNGTIHSKEVKVDMTGWSDFVFKKEYNLPTLEQIEKHIAEKGHLENIPSEEEVLKNGINLGEMNSKLLQKIEELTLYIIQQEKKNSEQAIQIEALRKENEVFENLLERLTTVEEKLKIEKNEK